MSKREVFRIWSSADTEKAYVQFDTGEITECPRDNRESLAADYLRLNLLDPRINVIEVLSAERFVVRSETGSEYELGKFASHYFILKRTHSFDFRFAGYSFEVWW